MRKHFVMLLVALISLAAVNGASAADKKKQFYDSKSQIIGVNQSGYDILCSRGFERKLFNNPVEVNVSLPTPEKKKKGFSEEQIENIASQLQAQNVGKKVLDALCLDQNGNPTDSILAYRAMYNVRYTDIERAEASLNDTESLLKDDWEPILANNYIYLECLVEDFMNYIVFKVDLPGFEDIKVRYEDMNAYNNLPVGLTFVSTGAEKIDEDHIAKFHRKLSESTAPFAIRGQLTGRNPATARMGSNDGLKVGDMVTLFRQSMDDNGNMVSNRISRARVNSVDDNDCQMFFIGGTKGSYKDGDMVVLTPDNGMGLGVYANYSTGKFFGVSLMWDKILHVTKAGFSGRVLARAKLDFADYDKDLWDKTDYNGPFIVGIDAGYGLAWTLLGRFELMPYAMIGAEYIRSTASKDYYYDIQAAGIRGTAGARFDLNIAYPFKLSVGAEYGYVYGLDAGNQQTNSDDKAIWVDYKDFKEMFKADGNKNRNGINFYVGVRWVF